jgi:hypothetical protein
MVDYLQHLIRGESLLTRAAKNVFKPGAMVLASSQMPSDKDRKKLDSSLQDIQYNPNSLFAVGGKSGHYLPEHGVVLGQVAANAANYLNSQRPSENRQSPLDSAAPVTAAQKAAYIRTLDIAQQPLLVLSRIKDGTITPGDVKTLTTLYPKLYTRLAEKVNNEMTEALSKGASVPYKTRIGLSMFLARPLDSTMTPTSILAAQPAPQQAQPQQAPQKASKTRGSAIDKLSKGAMTSSQSREADASRKE